MTGTFHIAIAMKPLEGTFAENALKHGVAGLAIDACRVGTTKDVPASPSRTAGCSLSGSVDGSLRNETGEENGHNPNIGRFPANVIHDASAEVLAGFPNTKARGNITPTKRRVKTEGWGNIGAKGEGCAFSGDSGSAARFFHAVEEHEKEDDQ